MGWIMKVDLFNAELEAQRSLLDLYEQAKKCRELFERANTPLPEVLKRVLGMNTFEGRPPISSVITAPEKPPMPPQAEADWIWIRAEEASPASAVLAVLRSAGGPLRPKDVV